MVFLGALFSCFMCLFGVGDAVCTMITEKQKKKKETEKKNGDENLEEEEES